MEFQCFEVKPEDDSKEITDKPSTGMFSVSWWGNFLHWCSLCTTLMLWCFYCLSTRVSVNDTRLNCDKSVHLSVRSSLDKYVKVKCLSKPIRPISQRWSPVPWPSVSQSYKTTNTEHWTSALSVRCVVARIYWTIERIVSIRLKFHIEIKDGTFLHKDHKLSWVHLFSHDTGKTANVIHRNIIVFFYEHINHTTFALIFMLFYCVRQHNAYGTFWKCVCVSLPICPSIEQPWLSG